MASSVRIRITHLVRTDPVQMHYFANFAEDVWRRYRDDRRVEVDLDAVDKGSPVLAITTRVSVKGRTLNELDKLIEESGLKETILLEAD